MIDDCFVLKTRELSGIGKIRIKEQIDELMNISRI